MILHAAVEYSTLHIKITICEALWWMQSVFELYTFDDVLLVFAVIAVLYLASYSRASRYYLCCANEPVKLSGPAVKHTSGLYISFLKSLLSVNVTTLCAYVCSHCGRFVSTRVSIALYVIITAFTHKEECV